MTAAVPATSSAPPHGSTGAPRVSPSLRVRMLPAAAHLWRVVDARGVAIGHVQELGDGRARRYLARRFHVASRAFRDLGEFWSADDAVQTLMFAR